MTMPETTVYKDASSVFTQNDIRMSRQTFMVQSVSESTFPQPLAHNQLQLRVLIVNRRHVLMPLLWSEVVHELITLT